MLAHAFRTIVAEHARVPGPERKIAITRNQIVHLYTALISHPAMTPAPAALAPTATASQAPRCARHHLRKPPENHKDHDLRLEYQAPPWPWWPTRLPGRGRGASQQLTAGGGDNIVHWTEFDRGGLFAAMEAPDLLVGDVRLFFRGVR